MDARYPAGPFDAGDAGRDGWISRGYYGIDKGPIVLMAEGAIGGLPWELTTLHGRARFVGGRAVEVDGRTIEAERVAIASGAEPAPLGFPGENHLITSEGQMVG